MAMAILSAALIPIGWMLTGTAAQSASTKAESAAASFASTLMNTLLEQVEFDDSVLDDTGGTPMVVDAGFTHAVVPGLTEIDGTTIRWILEVHDFTAAELWPEHWRVRFNAIPDCPPANPATFSLPAAPAAGTHYFVVNDATNDRNIAQLDSKIGPPTTPVLKEIKLIIQWQTPRDADFEDFTADTRTLKRTVVLMTRRARLAREIP